MPLNFVIIIRATARDGCKQKRSYAVNTCEGFPQSHDTCTRGEKEHGRGTRQWGLCSIAAHAERGQVRTNDEIWLVRRHSRHKACISRYGTCAHVVTWWRCVALAAHAEREDQIREKDESYM